ncbi:MAG: DUF6714 family protein [Aggregatilineales bacterium]
MFNDTIYPEKNGDYKAALQGKLRSELTFDDFAHMGDLSDFSDAVFRYYLPAILKFCLTNPTAELALNDDILRSFGGLTPPDTLRLKFLHRAELFTLSEREAIYDFLQSFLRLVYIDYFQIAPYQYHELSRAATFWKSSLTVPVLLSIDDRQWLSDEIQKAFADVSVPSENHLGDFDADELIIEIAGIKREDLTIDELHWLDTLLEVFTPEAYHYYLPAFISGMVSNHRNSGLLPSYILTSLTEPDYELSSERRNLFQDRVALFNDKQIAVIGTFLRLYKNLEPFGLWLMDDIEQAKLNEALDYWNK